MGNTFSNIQIKNNRHVSPEAFKTDLLKYFDKKGLVPADYDDASVSYRLAFSGSSDWVTLACGDYAPGAKEVHDEAEKIAKMLKTFCVEIGIVDSDMLLLELFDSKGKSDSIAAGRLLWGESETKDILGSDGAGIPEKWKPLLAEDKTWEEFKKIIGKSPVFIEETLVKLAPILEMDGENITLEYEDFDGENSQVLELCLKPKDAKKLSLNAAFVQVFGQALEPLGFVKLKKVKHPYFVRLIGDEILHIITYRKLGLEKMGYDSFEVLGGIVTLYRRNIDFTVAPGNWLNNNHWFYVNSGLELDEEFKKDINYFYYGVWEVNRENSVYESFNEEFKNREFRRSIINFHCKKDSVETMISGVENSLNVTKHIMLPIFDKVTDLNSCIEYFYKIRQGRMKLYDFEKLITNGYDTFESLLLIKADYRDDGIERMEREIAERVIEIENGTLGPGYGKDAEDVRNIFNSYRLEQIAIRDKMLDDPELNAKVMAELELRKAENLEIFRSYGIEI